MSYDKVLLLKRIHGKYMLYTEDGRLVYNTETDDLILGWQKANNWLSSFLCVKLEWEDGELEDEWERRMRGKR
jgi:hypothetical protein